MNELWSYNKDEGLNLDELHQFSHLLIESKDEEKVRNLASTLEWFIVVKEIQAFNGASLNYTSFPIVKFNFSPAGVSPRSRLTTSSPFPTRPRGPG